jgi:GMP synthase-like glutamine amidotransferase
MICFVDIEHEKALQDEGKRTWHLGRRAVVKLKLEEISGQLCLLQRYPSVTRQRLAEWGIKALVISGNASDWVEYSDSELAEMLHVIRAAELPIIGLCGGGQLIAMAHGAALGSIRRLREGERDPNPDYSPGYFKERDYMPVRVVQPAPLFEGLGSEPVFWQSHYWEMKEIPPGFELLASTDECPIQVIRQVGKPVYGTQFHPEHYTDEYPDGRKLLANFFKIAGIIR